MSFLKKSYQTLISFSSSLQSLFLLAVRLFWGFLFFQTGSGKLKQLTPIAKYLDSLDIPFPEISAYLLAGTETIGGICLIAGIASRLICLPLIFAMLMAFLTAHFESVKNIFNDPSEFLKQGPMTFLLAALIIFIFGPGKFSIDYIVERLIGKGK